MMCDEVMEKEGGFRRNGIVACLSSMASAVCVQRECVCVSWKLCGFAVGFLPFSAEKSP